MRGALTQDTLPIVKGVLIPPAHQQGRKALFQRTLQACAVGDSFLWTENHRCYGYAKEIGARITTRRFGDQFRIWRR